MHMTCSPPCGYQFCWLCLGPYMGHDGVACNQFNKKEGRRVDEVEQQKEAARKAIERYTHYYERWAANERSRKQARLSLDKIETVYLNKLSLTYRQPEMQLRFIIDAWLQIVECRRVLKWTYVYGYYIPEIEHAKRLFFEYVQGEAEVGLERLHGCAEKELQTYIVNGEATEEEFNSFRVKLTGLTSVTRSYFENLVRALENGLSEVDSHEQGGSSRVRRRSAGQGGESSNRASDYAKRMRRPDDEK
ncbi:putative E3 ubiquitin ligase RBR family [Helianthus annuus]|nr:putative E3 ubiquitin ligase RBR family [Helianthus annuus]